MLRRIRPIVLEQGVTAGLLFQLQVIERLMCTHIPSFCFRFNVDLGRADVYAMHLCLNLVHNLSRISYALLQDQMA